MTVPIATLEQLAALIRDATGNLVPPARFDFLREIAERRAHALGLKTSADYVRALAAGELDQEWPTLVPLITIKESYFFRAPQQFETLERELLPRLLRARGASRRLRIWSAACARGEEPATLAMVLAEQAELAGWDWDIVATDLDEEALAGARRGLYGERAVAQVPPALLARYFLRRGKLFELVPELRARIDYRRLNLAEPPFSLPSDEYDLILLRNVLIYFPRPLQTWVMTHVAQTLSRKGILFLGASETLWQIQDELEAVDLGTCYCYRHRRARVQTAAPLPATPDSRAAASPLDAKTAAPPVGLLQEKQRRTGVAAAGSGGVGDAADRSSPAVGARSQVGSSAAAAAPRRASAASSERPGSAAAPPPRVAKSQAPPAASAASAGMPLTSRDRIASWDAASPGRNALPDPVSQGRIAASEPVAAHGRIPVPDPGSRGRVAPPTPAPLDSTAAGSSPAGNTGFEASAGAAAEATGGTRTATGAAAEPRPANVLRPRPRSADSADAFLPSVPLRPDGTGSRDRVETRVGGGTKAAPSGKGEEAAWAQPGSTALTPAHGEEAPRSEVPPTGTLGAGNGLDDGTLPDAGIGSAADLLLRAVDELAANRADAARLAVDAALAADPSVAAVHALDGFLHDLAGRAEEAAACYRAALYLDPALFQARLLLADCLLRLGQRDRAEHQFREVLATLDAGRDRPLPLFEPLAFPTRERAQRRCRQALQAG